MNSKELLMRLSSAVGVSGRENSVVNMAAEELKALGEVTVSPLGDLICCVQKPKEGEKCFMLDAHVDEIGMIVTWIDDEGFLKVSSVGGFDRSLAENIGLHTIYAPGLPGKSAAYSAALLMREAIYAIVEDVEI